MHNVLTRTDRSSDTDMMASLVDRRITVDTRSVHPSALRMSCGRRPVSTRAALFPACVVLMTWADVVGVTVAGAGVGVMIAGCDDGVDAKGLASKSTGMFSAIGGL